MVLCDYPPLTEHQWECGYSTVYNRTGFQLLALRAAADQHGTEPRSARHHALLPSARSQPTQRRSNSPRGKPEAKISLFKPPTSLLLLALLLKAAKEEKAFFFA